MEFLKLNDTYKSLKAANVVYSEKTQDYLTFVEYPKIGEFIDSNQYRILHHSGYYSRPRKVYKLLVKKGLLTLETCKKLLNSN